MWKNEIFTENETADAEESVHRVKPPADDVLENGSGFTYEIVKEPIGGSTDGDTFDSEGQWNNLGRVEPWNWTPGISKEAGMRMRIKLVSRRLAKYPHVTEKKPRTRCRSSHKSLQKMECRLYRGIGTIRWASALLPSPLNLKGEWIAGPIGQRDTIYVMKRKCQVSQGAWLGYLWSQERLMNCRRLTNVGMVLRIYTIPLIPVMRIASRPIHPADSKTSGASRARWKRKIRAFQIDITQIDRHQTHSKISHWCRSENVASKPTQKRIDHWQ